MKLQGARVLITGGSSGIGKAAAALLASCGCRIAITGRDEERLFRAAEEIGAFAICADVSSEEDVERTYNLLLERFRGIDCLINNAGIGVHAPLTAVRSEDFERIWRVNVLGPMLMSQRAAQLMIEQQHGTIVNIASTAALRGFENGTAYVASKFALRGMSECWRAELRRSNIRVITINPSEVPTAFGSPTRSERPEEKNKLTSREIAHSIKAALEMDDRGFIPELTVFATNPF